MNTFLKPRISGLTPNLSSSQHCYILRVSFCLPIFILAVIEPVTAREWYVESSAGLTATYDDNITLAPDETESQITDDSITIEPPRDTSGFIPEFEMTIGTASQVTDINLNLGADLSRYSDNELNSDNGFALLEFTRTTELSSFGLTGGLQRNSTLTTEFEESGLLQTNERRKELSITPSWSRQLSESMSIDIEVDHSDVSFGSDNDNNEAPFDFNEDSITTTLTRILNERTDIFGDVEFTRFDSPDNDDNESEDLAISIGVSRQLTELLASDFSVGSQSSDTEQTIDGERISESNSGAIYEVGLSWSFPVTSVSLDASRSLSSSGLGTRSEQTSFGIGVSREISERLSVYLDGTLSEDAFLTTADTIVPDRKFYTIEPGFTWDLTSNWQLEASYVYRKQKLDDTRAEPSTDSLPLGTGTSTTSNALFSTVRYRWPRRPF